MDNEKKFETKENRNVVINSETPEMLTNNIYTPAFLRENIGKLMRVEFLIGTNNLVDRLESDVITYADLYSIKFITISNLPYNMLLNFNNGNSMNMIGNNSYSNSYLNNTQMPNQEMNYRYY